jgi:hypothetical protein
LSYPGKPFSVFGVNRQSSLITQLKLLSNTYI